jgi:hypothetical protein
LARRIAVAMSGATEEKPDGSPRLRSTIRVPPLAVSSRGRGVSQATARVLAYQRVALPGSVAKDATSARGRVISVEARHRRARPFLLLPAGPQALCWARTMTA